MATDNRAAGTSSMARRVSRFEPLGNSWPIR
jgi:hypothetical protein